MKHEIIRADENLQKMSFLFECKYFDGQGALNKIEKFSSEIINSRESSQKGLLSDKMSFKTIPNYI